MCCKVCAYRESGKSPLKASVATVSAFTSSSLNGGAAESLERIPGKDSSSTGSDPATSASSTALSCSDTWRVCLFISRGRHESIIILEMGNTSLNCQQKLRTQVSNNIPHDYIHALNKQFHTHVVLHITPPC